MNHSRRAVLQKTAWAAASAYLAQLGLSTPATAQDAPKPGGGMVYAVTSPNMVMGDASNGLHPYHWIDLANRSCYNALT